MGVYSQYASVAGDGVVANESYAGAIGAYKMIEECSMNQHAIFEAIIGRDFLEVQNAINPGAVTESELQAVNEASLSDIWKKVVEFVQKIWEKILGIFKTMKDKIQSVFIKDGKKLVDQYKKQINKKWTDGKLSKLKVKWITYDYEKNLKDLDITNTDLGEKYQVNINTANNMKNQFEKGFEISYGRDKDNNFDNSIEVDIKTHTVSDVNKSKDTMKYNELKGIAPYTSDEQEDMTDAFLTKILGTNTDASSFKQDFKDKVETDEDTDKAATDVLNDVSAVLTTYKKSKNKIEKDEKEINRDIKKWYKDAESVQKAMSKLFGKENNNALAAASNRCASRAIVCCNILSKGFGMYTACLFDTMKEEFKQARSVWVKAATFNQKGEPFEEAVMMEAVGEVSDYEVEEMFAL